MAQFAEDLVCSLSSRQSSMAEGQGKGETAYDMVTGSREQSTVGRGRQTLPGHTGSHHPPLPNLTYI